MSHGFEGHDLTLWTVPERARSGVQVERLRTLDNCLKASPLSHR